MNACGIHTYMGGMQVGVSRVLRDLGSCESWRPAAEARDVLGLRTLPVGANVRSWLTYSNPPCSRFSPSANDYFGDDDRGQLSRFDCLAEVLGHATASGSRVLWWETGPLAFAQGEGIIRELHEAFGARRTWVVRVCATHVGVPQRRLRTHVVHFRDGASCPSLAPRPSGALLRPWLAAATGGAEGTPAGPGPDEWAEWGCRTWEDYVAVHQVVGKRVSWHPRLIQDDAAHSPVIMSRPIGWADRLMTIEEAACLMGYDHARLAPHLERRQWHRWLMLMGKGVCSHVAEAVCREVASRAGQPGEEGVTWHRVS